MSAAVLTEKRNHVFTITLNRPAARNLINLDMAQALHEACLQANGDADVYVVVISGAGETFSIGSELEQWAAGGHNGPSPDFAPVASVVASVEKPVIAAIKGDALGQGLEIALACDVRLAAATARFGFPGVAAGLLPVDGGTQRLPRLVGKGKALELLFTAQTIDAAGAEGIGLVSRVVPQEALEKEASALAESMGAKAPIALRYAKEAVNKGLDMSLEQGLRLEADLYFLLHTTSDRTEGIRAFLEKRKPEFKGK